MTRTYCGKKLYIHDTEIEIDLAEDTTNMMRWCKSPLCTIYPSCGRAFYACEYEETYGTVKHEPKMRAYKRPKVGTSISCWEMPLKYCQRLVDYRDMKCPHCGRLIEVEEE